MEEQDLGSRLDTEVKLLANVTNQPASISYFNPLRFDGKLAAELPFSGNLCLGEEYNVKFWQILKEHRYSGEHLWMVDDTGYELKEKSGRVISRKRYGSSEGYEKTEIDENPRIIDNSRLNFLIENIRGMDVRDTPFMDFERYTLESLEGDKSYFKSIYLTIMCHLKEKGIKLPPILSKKADIRESMHRGNIESLDGLLWSELDKIKTREYMPGMVFHATQESEKIREYAFERRQYHDKSIPLIEKMPRLNVRTIPGKRNTREYNVLVVEDFGGIESIGDDRMGTIGRLSEKVAKELQNHGGYGGTKIFSTMRIADCINICGTGQIDAILMDGGHFLLGEAEESLLLFNEGARISLSQGGEQLDIPGMEGYGEKKYWKNLIFEAVRANGYSTPPCLIIPTDIMNMAVGKFVLDMIENR